MSFVVSRSCSEGFSPGSAVFLRLEKPTYYSIWKQWTKSLSMDVPLLILINE